MRFDFNSNWQRQSVPRDLQLLCSTVQGTGTCSGWMTWRGKDHRYPSILTCTGTGSSPPVLLPPSCCFDAFLDSFLGGGSVDMHSRVGFLWACDAKPVSIPSQVVIARGFGICLGLLDNVLLTAARPTAESQSRDADRT
jgi:hypothetical protein